MTSAPSSEATPRPETVSKRLRLLADWLDIQDDKLGYDGDREVQRDLRADADSYDESRKLLREAAEKLDALTLMLRSMKEARNGTALDMDGDELFGFVLPHESYMNAHMILNDAAWFARITAHLEAGQ